VNLHTLPSFSDSKLPFQSDHSIDGSLPKLLFSEKESAHVLSVSLRTVQNLIATKQLKVRRIGRRVLIHRKDLEAFARRDHPSAIETVVGRDRSHPGRAKAQSKKNKAALSADRGKVRQDAETPRSQSQTISVDNADQGGAL
jgi:excisionase family DNA binding protein